MEAVELQIKDSILKLLKGIDPEVDVYFEEMPHTDREHGAQISRTWYFVDIVPGKNQTVDGIYTDKAVLIDIAYHAERESNMAYLLKAAEIDTAIRPVLRFGDRKITIPDADIAVTDRVLHYVFHVSFRHSLESADSHEPMGELDVRIKKESE